MRDWNDPRGGIWASGWKCSTEKATAHRVVEGRLPGGRGGEREHLPGPRSQALWQCLPPECSCPSVHRAENSTEVFQCCCEGYMRSSSDTSWPGTSSLAQGHPTLLSFQLRCGSVPGELGGTWQGGGKGAFRGKPALLQHSGFALCRPLGCILFTFPKHLGVFTESPGGGKT